MLDMLSFSTSIRTEFSVFEYNCLNNRITQIYSKFCIQISKYLDTTQLWFETVDFNTEHVATQALEITQTEVKKL